MNQLNIIDSTQVQKQLDTVIDFVRYACSMMNRADLYFGHGTDNAWDDAVLLVFHAINFPLELGSKISQAKLLDMEKQKVLQLLEKRINDKVPLPYLTNHINYCDLDFYVDDRVLIPRSPITELIEHKFSPWLEEDKVQNILELCTGSGCISIAMAYAFENAVITASDISEQALEVAAINVEALGVTEQVCLLQSDVYKNIPETKYDLIVANPPYVSSEEMEILPEEYLQEPRLALEAEQDGLAIVIEIIQGGKRYLNEGGILVVEVGNSENALIEKYPEVPFTWLEFERGGTGVFLISYQQLHLYF